MVDGWIDAVTAADRTLWANHIKQRQRRELPRYAAEQWRVFDTVIDKIVAAEGLDCRSIGGAPRGSDGLVELPADLLSFLADPVLQAILRHCLVRLSHAAFVGGPVRLTDLSTGLALEFADCRFEGALVLERSAFHTIRLDRCTLGGPLFADRIRVTHGIYATGLMSQSGLRLRFAEIGGSLELPGAVLISPKHAVFPAEGGDANATPSTAEIDVLKDLADEPWDTRPADTAAGAAQQGAQTGSEQPHGPNGAADEIGDALIHRADVLMTAARYRTLQLADTKIDLRGARIGGNLNLSLATIVGGPVSLQGAEIRGYVAAVGLFIMNPRSRQAGEARSGAACGTLMMTRASIGGSIVLSSIDLHPIMRPRIRRALQHPFVRRIKSEWLDAGLQGDESRLQQPAFVRRRGAVAVAQLAERVKALESAADGESRSQTPQPPRDGEEIALRCIRFTSVGLISLAEARIGGGLRATNAAMINPGDRCLVADGAQFSRTVTLDHGFQSLGVVSFNGAFVDGRFDATGGNFHHGGKSGSYALEMTAMRVKRSMRLSTADRPSTRAGGRWLRFVAFGGVRLRRSEIGGNLNMNGALIAHDPHESRDGTVEGGPPTALSAAGLKVGGHIYIAHQSVDVRNRRAAGTATDGEDARSAGPGAGPERVIVPFESFGLVRLRSCQVGRSLHIIGARLRRGLVQGRSESDGPSGRQTDQSRSSTQPRHTDLATMLFRDYEPDDAVLLLSGSIIVADLFVDSVALEPGERLYRAKVVSKGDTTAIHAAQDERQAPEGQTPADLKTRIDGIVLLQAAEIRNQFYVGGTEFHYRTDDKAAEPDGGGGNSSVGLSREIYDDIRFALDESQSLGSLQAIEGRQAFPFAMSKRTRREGAAIAVFAKSVKIANDLYFAPQVSATGELCFADSKIGGSVRMDGIVVKIDLADEIEQIRQLYELEIPRFNEGGGGPAGGGIDGRSSPDDHQSGEFLSFLVYRSKAGPSKVARVDAGDPERPGSGHESYLPSLFSLAAARAVSFRHAVIENECYFRGCVFVGRFSLDYAQINGRLSFSGTVVEGFESGFADQAHRHAVSMDFARIGGSVGFSDGFHAVGPVLLRSARIGGWLRCENGTFVNRHVVGNAIDATAAEIGGAVSLCDGLTESAWLEALRHRPRRTAGSGSMEDDLRRLSGEFGMLVNTAVRHLPSGSLARFIILSKIAQAQRQEHAAAASRSGGTHEPGRGDCPETNNDAHKQSGSDSSYGADGAWPFQSQIDGVTADDSIESLQQVLSTFLSVGTAKFDRCRIVGDFEAGGGLFWKPHGIGLSLEGARIGGDVRLTRSRNRRYRFQCHGVCRINHCSIGGRVDAEYALFGAPFYVPDRWTDPLRTQRDAPAAKADAAAIVAEQTAAATGSGDHHPLEPQAPEAIDRRSVKRFFEGLHGQSILVVGHPLSIAYGDVFGIMAGDGQEPSAVSPTGSSSPPGTGQVQNDPKDKSPTIWRFPNRLGSIPLRAPCDEEEARSRAGLSLPFEFLDHWQFLFFCTESDRDVWKSADLHAAVTFQGTTIAGELYWRWIDYLVPTGNSAASRKPFATVDFSNATTLKLIDDTPTWGCYADPRPPELWPAPPLGASVRPRWLPSRWHPLVDDERYYTVGIWKPPPRSSVSDERRLHLFESKRYDVNRAGLDAEKPRIRTLFTYFMDLRDLKYLRFNLDGFSYESVARQVRAIDNSFAFHLGQLDAIWRRDPSDGVLFELNRAQASQPRPDLPRVAMHRLASVATWSSPHAHGAASEREQTSSGVVLGWALLSLSLDRDLWRLVIGKELYGIRFFLFEWRINEVLESIDASAMQGTGTPAADRIISYYTMYPGRYYEKKRPPDHFLKTAAMGRSGSGTSKIISIWYDKIEKIEGMVRIFWQCMMGTVFRLVAYLSSLFLALFGIDRRRPWVKTVAVSVPQTRGHHQSLLQPAFEVTERWRPRLYWLNAQELDRASHQPFDHLADIYDRTSMNDHGFKIIGGKYKRKRATASLGYKVILWLYALVRNGYGPGPAFLGIALVTFAATWISIAVPALSGALYPALAGDRALPPELQDTREALCLVDPSPVPLSAATRSDGAPSDRRPVPSEYSFVTRLGERMISEDGDVRLLALLNRPLSDAEALRDRTPLGYPDFDRTLYALDVFLPIVDLKQVSHWEISSDFIECVERPALHAYERAADASPSGGAQDAEQVARGRQAAAFLHVAQWSQRWSPVLQAIGSLVGWVLTTLLVVSLTSFVQRRMGR